MKMFSHSAITVVVIAVAMVLVMTSETDESDEDERENLMSDCFKTYSHCMGTGQNGCIDRYVFAFITRHGFHLIELI